MEIIGEYQGKPNLGDFAHILDNTGREFGDALLVVENNSLGISILEKLQDKEYPNLYYSVKSTHEYVDQLQAEGLKNSVAGFTTSSKTRPLIVAKMEEFIRNKLINLYSSRTINELKTFIWHNNRPQAMRSYHDDLVMSLAIMCWVRDTALEISKRDLEYNRAMVNSMIKSNTSLNTTIAGMTGHQPIRNADQINKRKEFLWLYKG